MRPVGCVRWGNRPRPQTQDGAPRARVARTSDELRLQEWHVARPLTCSEWVGKSDNEKTNLSLTHDIARPNQDRYYRRLSLFLRPLITDRELNIRVFDVLRSVSGDTSLRINVIGDMETGERSGFIDFPGSNRHTRWIQP